VAAVAKAFVEENQLRGGEGCDSGDCVAAMVASAMRQRLGDSSFPTTRVSVSGEVYRRQGAAFVEQELSLAFEEEEERPPPREHFPKMMKTRTVRAPCVPPFCEVECAINDAKAEARLASEFIAQDEELSALIKAWPSPRTCEGGPIFPIFIGAPAEDFVACVPRKYRGFAEDGMREQHETFAAYRFGPGQEAEYKRSYRDAYFGRTKRKAGWDCLRHYKTLAAGAVPFFFVGDLSSCPEKTLSFVPKKLLARIASGSFFAGVEKTVDAPRLDAQGLYPAVAAGLLSYARQRLTTTALARYVLEASGHANATSALVLSSHPDPDYQRDMLVHGLRTVLGAGLVDFVRPRHLYAPPRGTKAPYLDDDENNLYGHGFTYAHRLSADDGVDRTDLDRRIRAHDFDLVVYASVHRGMPFWPAVAAAYAPRDRVFVDGEDHHGWSPFSAALRSEGSYFMRELPDGCPPPSHPPLSFHHFHGPFHHRTTEEDVSEEDVSEEDVSSSSSDL